RADRRRELSGSRYLKEFRRTPLRATFEVVYGHAWKRPPADQTVKTVRVFKRIPWERALSCGNLRGSVSTPSLEPFGECARRGLPFQEEHGGFSLTLKRNCSISPS